MCLICPELAQVPSASVTPLSWCLLSVLTSPRVSVLCPLLPPWPQSWLPVTRSQVSVGHRSPSPQHHGAQGRSRMKSQELSKMKFIKKVLLNLEKSSILKVSSQFKWAFHNSATTGLLRMCQFFWMAFEHLTMNIYRMLNSPKMQRIQRSVRINDGQLLGLAEKARWRMNFKMRSINYRKELLKGNLKYSLFAFQ